jgi:hypothetical protein
MDMDDIGKFLERLEDAALRVAVALAVWKDGRRAGAETRPPGPRMDPQMLDDLRVLLKATRGVLGRNGTGVGARADAQRDIDAFWSKHLDKTRSREGPAETRGD